MSTMNRRRKPGVLQNRNKLNFETKIKIFEKYHKYKPSIISLAREWNVATSTIKRIVQDTLSYKLFLSKPYATQRSVIYEMERQLSIWIEDRIQRNLPITVRGIQDKSVHLYVNIKRFYPPFRLAFEANDEWFTQYRQRAGYRDLKLTNEFDADSITRVQRFPGELKTVIDVLGYLPQQVFNVDRVLLFWKNMPDGTFISKKAEEIASDRVTLVLGFNARGDCKLKPLMVYNTDKPRGVKDILYKLPVYYRSSPTSWLTAQIFEEWFINNFIPETKQYCQQKGIPFKILLLLDTAPRYRKRLIGLHPSVKVVFLPRNTAQLLQPMDQGIKSIFKAYYFSHTLNMVTQATKGDTDIMVQDFCEAYTIQMGISNITQAWKSIPSTFLAAAWKNTCPHFLDVRVIPQDNALYQGIKRQIVLTAAKLGFKMNVKEVENLVQSTGCELTNNDLIVLAKLNDVGEANGEVDLTEIEKSNDVLKFVQLTEVDAGQHLLVEYSPKQGTSNEDEDSMDCEVFRIDFITVEEPELVESTLLNVVPLEKVKEEIMELSDSESSHEPLTVNPSINEMNTLQVIDTAINVDDSLAISHESNKSYQKALDPKVDVSYQDTDNEKPLKVDEFQSPHEMPANVIAEEIELAFDHVTCAMEKFESVDPNNARFQAVRSAVNDMLSCYREMFEEKRQLRPSDAENR